MGPGNLAPHPPGFEPWTSQFVASRCTDYAVRLINNTVGNISLVGFCTSVFNLWPKQHFTQIRKVIIKVSYLKAYYKFMYRTDIDAHSAVRRQALYV
jgi:hypothetical protein